MQEVNPSKFKNLWKTKKAAENIKPILLEIVDIYWRKTWKPQGKVTRKDLADRVFSEYCRLYYADEKWYVRCITSGVRMFWKEAQCWHFISRWINKYRFDILNCYPQSYVENCTLWGNYKVYTIKMIKMLWQDKVEEMLNDKQSVSYNQIWYENNIIERYNFIQKKKEIISNNS